MKLVSRLLDEWQESTLALCEVPAYFFRIRRRYVLI